MPIHQGYEWRDGERWGYYQYGNEKKYYYTPGNERSRKAAYTKALNQMRAIKANGG